MNKIPSFVKDKKEYLDPFHTPQQKRFERNIIVIVITGLIIGILFGIG